MYLRQLQEKFGAKKKELFLVFVDFEKTKSEEEAVRKFGVWKREMETRGLKSKHKEDQVDGDG